MDSVTQIALGIATAEIVAGKQLQNKTFLYGAILGTIPDLDIVLGKFLPEIDGIALHRGWSHSILFFIGLSPLLGWILTRIEKNSISFLKATILVFSCLFTHVLLDLFTSWGTQILWPLPNRFALKTIFVIDLLYTIPLVLSLIFVWKSSVFELRKKYLLRGFFISSSYLLLTCILKIIAVNQFEQALNSKKLNYQELIVKPTAFNCILWNANVATAHGYWLGDYSFFDSQPIQFTYYQKNIELEKKIQTSSDFEKLKTISEGWYLVTTTQNQLYFNDLRFGILNDNIQKPQFAFSYQFYINNDGNYQAKEVLKTKRDGKLLLQKLLIRIKGN